MDKMNLVETLEYIRDNPELRKEFEEQWKMRMKESTTNHTDMV